MLSEAKGCNSANFWATENFCTNLERTAQANLGNNFYLIFLMPKELKCNSWFTFLGTEFVHKNFGRVYPVYRHRWFFNLHPIPIVFVSSTPKDQPRSPSRAWKRSPELQGKLEIFVSQPVKTWTNFGKFREYV